jgi:hypothetical protein
VEWHVVIENCSTTALLRYEVTVSNCIRQPLPQLAHPTPSVLNPTPVGDPSPASSVVSQSSAATLPRSSAGLGNPPVFTEQPPVQPPQVPPASAVILAPTPMTSTQTAIQTPSMPQTNWLSVSHTGGVIPPSAASTLLLYVNRQHTGIFSAHIIIRNKSNVLQSPQAVSVHLEVVPPDHDKL